MDQRQLSIGSKDKIFLGDSQNLKRQFEFSKVTAFLWQSLAESFPQQNQFSLAELLHQSTD